MKGGGDMQEFWCAQKDLGVCSPIKDFIIGDLHDYIRYNLPHPLKVLVNLQHHRKCIHSHD